MPCCRDVVIQLIRAQPIPAAGHIDVLGGDDFAVRRGQSCNTILTGMNTRKPVDVLPDRESATLAAWLRAAAAAQVEPAAPEPPAPVPLPAAEPAAPPGALTGWPSAPGCATPRCRNASPEACPAPLPRRS
jgi:hypothetical protein